MALFRSIMVAEWIYVRHDMSKGLKIMSRSDNYEIENPREVRKITSEWLLITGSLTILCVTPTPHTSRDRSRFLRMMLFINNTKSTFYETKVLKTKHVSFLKYIYKLIMLYWFSTGHSDQCHWEIYRSQTGANFDHC